METSLCVIRHVQGASHRKALFLMMYLVCTVLVKWFKYTFKRGLCLEDLLLNSLQKFILKNLKPLVQSRISTICHGPSFIHPGPTILLPAWGWWLFHPKQGSLRAFWATRSPKKSCPSQASTASLGATRHSQFQQHDESTFQSAWLLSESFALLNGLCLLKNPGHSNMYPASFRKTAARESANKKLRVPSPPSWIERLWFRHLHRKDYKLELILQQYLHLRSLKYIAQQCLHHLDCDISMHRMCHLLKIQHHHTQMLPHNSKLQQQFHHLSDDMTVEHFVPVRNGPSNCYISWTDDWPNSPPPSESHGNHYPNTSGPQDHWQQ